MKLNVNTKLDINTKPNVHTSLKTRILRVQRQYETRSPQNSNETKPPHKAEFISKPHETRHPHKRDCKQSPFFPSQTRHARTRLKSLECKIPRNYGAIKHFQLSCLFFGLKILQNILHKHHIDEMKLDSAIMLVSSGLAVSLFSVSDAACL